MVCCAPFVLFVADARSSIFPHLSFSYYLTVIIISINLVPSEKNLGCLFLYVAIAIVCLFPMVDRGFVIIQKEAFKTVLLENKKNKKLKFSRVWIQF